MSTDNVIRRPALNESDDAMKYYGDLVMRNALGWPEQRLMSSATRQRIELTHDEMAQLDATPTTCTRNAQSAVLWAQQHGITPLSTDLQLVARRDSSK